MPPQSQPSSTTEATAPWFLPLPPLNPPSNLSPHNSPLAFKPTPASTNQGLIPAGQTSSSIALAVPFSYPGYEKRTDKGNDFVGASNPHGSYLGRVSSTTQTPSFPAIGSSKASITGVEPYHLAMDSPFSLALAKPTFPWQPPVLRDRVVCFWSSPPRFILRSQSIFVWSHILILQTSLFNPLFYSNNGDQGICGSLSGIQFWKAFIFCSYFTVASSTHS
jgi:hypothetical protein